MSRFDISPDTYAAVGRVIEQPNALLNWMRDPHTFHETQRGTVPDYDETQFDRVLQPFAELPETQMTRFRDEMMRVFQDLTDKAEEAFDNLQMMSNVLFYLGVIIVALTALIELAGVLGANISWQTLAVSGGILGTLGMSSLIGSFITGSMDKLQHAVSNLAQIEVAFLGFVEELNTISYRKPQTVDEARKRVGMIDKARQAVMADLERYLEGTTAQDKLNPQPG